MTYEKRQKYAIFAKIAKMINMAKTGGENGKTDLKKSESGPTKMWKLTDENVKVGRQNTDMPEVDRVYEKCTLY